MYAGVIYLPSFSCEGTVIENYFGGLRWCNNIVGRMLALHAIEPGSSLGIPYVFPSQLGMISWCRARNSI